MRFKIGDNVKYKDTVFDKDGNVVFILMEKGRIGKIIKSDEKNHRYIIDWGEPFGEDFGLDDELTLG